MLSGEGTLSVWQEGTLPVPHPLHIFFHRERQKAGGSKQGNVQYKVTAKKPRKGWICGLLNSALSGCPYGRDCIFTHRCTNRGSMNKHGRLSCHFPLKPIQEPALEEGQGLYSCCISVVCMIVKANMHIVIEKLVYIQENSEVKVVQGICKLGGLGTGYSGSKQVDAYSVTQG